MKRTISTALLSVAAACTGMPPSAVVPDALKPGAAEAPMVRLGARGVQIYECRAKQDDPQATEWSFVAPEADLFDAQGLRVGKHYAGPHWESVDGSKVLGSGVRARADAPRPGAIPWLLLTAKSVGPPGAFARATSVQRINTTGGMAPAAGECTATTIGNSARVSYSADYVMFAGP